MSPPHANRLARESSPYLRLHAHNPVDWYPWGAEAIATARREEKPIFLSVGYSTCYWCHVMERESFSDPAVAEQMNRDFVNVKVDREERPDLDEIYMLATQILAGQGGWPNSVFLTPQLRPFFAGTYFPPVDAHGRPGFPSVLRSLAHAWNERRPEVETQAAELAVAIGRHLEEIAPVPGPLPGAELAERALAGLRQRFDPTWGGFGQQPKFPTPSNLWLLAAEAERVPAASMMLTATLDAMARGGICDQLAGGFHRYATDREWRIPHFEKMLYDNGLLLELYAAEHARTGGLEARRVALTTAGWIAAEMTSPEGAFWSALDAETGGHEGAYYVWSRAELEAALGAEDTTFLGPIFGFAGEPFFEDKAYVLHLPRSLEVAARERRTTREALLSEIEPLRAELLAVRSRRPRPATDDKILADWNGIAIAGLAVAGELLAEPALVARAARAADFVLAAMRRADGVQLHAWRGGEGRIAAFLGDYVWMVRGLLRLYRASGEARWLAEAARLAEEQARRLESPRGGFFNAEEAEDLLFRGKELFDGAMPAANAVAALNLLELHAATADGRHLERAERTLRAFAPLVATHPDGARAMSVAFLRRAEGSRLDAGNALVAESVKDSSSGESGAVAVTGMDLEPAEHGGFREFRLRLRVKAGWHLAMRDDTPRLEGAGAALERVEWPTARPLGGPGESGRLPAFVGDVEVRGRVRPEAPHAALLLRYEACGDGRCLPAAEIEVSLL